MIYSLTYNYRGLNTKDQPRRYTLDLNMHPSADSVIVTVEKMLEIDDDEASGIGEIVIDYDSMHIEVTDAEKWTDQVKVSVKGNIPRETDPNKPRSVR